MRNSLRIQAPICNSSSVNTTNWRVERKSQSTNFIMNTWEKPTQKKQRTGNPTTLKRLISSEVSIRWTPGALTPWEKPLNKSLLRNGLKTLSPATTITRSGTWLIKLRKIAIIFPQNCKYYGENILLKKILTTLTGVEKIALLNRRQTHTRSALKFIIQSKFFSSFSLSRHIHRWWRSQHLQKTRI